VGEKRMFSGWGPNLGKILLGRWGGWFKSKKKPSKGEGAVLQDGTPDKKKKIILTKKESRSINLHSGGNYPFLKGKGNPGSEMVLGRSSCGVALGKKRVEGGQGVPENSQGGTKG